MHAVQTLIFHPWHILIKFLLWLSTLGMKNMISRSLLWLLSYCCGSCTGSDRNSATLLGCSEIRLWFSRPIFFQSLGKDQNLFLSLNFETFLTSFTKIVHTLKKMIRCYHQSWKKKPTILWSVSSDPKPSSLAVYSPQ